MKGEKINILFVCKYNRFRSRIADAYFKKINKNKNIKSKSAGLFRGNPLSPLTVSIAKEMGLDITGQVKGISSKMLQWQDITVIVADDVPESIFDDFVNNDDKKVLHWKFKDVLGKNIKKRERIMLQIQEKIEYFLSRNK